VRGGTKWIDAAITAVQAWHRKVTAPTAEIVDDENRRRATVIASVALVLAIILTVSAVISTITSILLPDPTQSLGLDGTLVVAFTATMFWVGVYLARQRRFEIGAWFTILTISAFLLGIGLLYPDYGAVMAFGFAVPVMSATIFLRLRGTIAVLCLSAILGTLTLVLTNTTWFESFFVAGVMVAITVLALVISLLREGDLEEVVRLRTLEQADAERLQGELALARSVQEAMLPDQLPELLGFDLAAYSEAAFEASGDFYDVFTLDAADDSEQPSIGIVVCDVAGKGVAAALIMAATRTALRAEAERSGSPATVLARVNDTLAASLPSGLFATICYSIFDPTTSSLRYASAGHPHPLHWSNDTRTVAELESYGMPLGLVAGSVYDEKTQVLAPGDCVMVFTDGLVEALDVDRAMYGFDRTTTDFTRRAGHDGTAASRLDGVVDDLRAFIADERLHDDVTIVTIAVPDLVVDATAAEATVSTG
jgi:serine phosphatase RsbU (regulator of sigma subunit)